MKKILITTIIFLSVGLISCGSSTGDKDCKHDFKWEITTPATNCVGDVHGVGVETQICTLCQETGETLEISCLGTIGLTYTDVTGGREVTGINPRTSIVCIPDYNNEKPVISIGEYAFGEENPSLADTTITKIVGNNIKSIGEGAFEECAALTTVSFPAVISIDDYAFGWCESLTEVSFPAATSIGYGAFYACEALEALTEVNFPLVTSIDDEAFGFCAGLTKVSFPEAVSIGDDAFFACENLTEIDFPKATSIGEWAFAWCNALIKVTLGTITEENFSSDFPFPGNLRSVYFAAGGGAGTYTRVGFDWTKQP